VRTVWNRLISAVVALGATALVTAALAEPRGKPAPVGKPKPPAVRDAGAGAEGEGGEAGVKPAAVPEPPGGADIGDGGARPSPLNPAPQELAGGVDAGTPIEYDRLLADIAALRARVAALADNLYQSRIAIALLVDGDHARLGRLTVSLDDGIVYTAPAAFSASDLTTVYDHAVAPGRHAVTVDVERKDDRDEAFRTAQRSRFTVDVPRDNRLEVDVRILDDSSMGGDFPSDKSGKYDLRVRVKAAAKPSAGK
jgi:hypothetical protein